MRLATRARPAAVRELTASPCRFGPRVGFIKFKTTAELDVGGEKGVITVPGIVFMRGGSIGVLVILECDGEEFTILTNQARVPVGGHAVPEIPAGMIDGAGNFKGVAAEEIQEECNMVITEDELVDLTELAYGERYRGMLPSPGGCDEFIKLYSFRRVVERDVLAELQGRLTGLLSEGEHIKLQIVKLSEAWQRTPDAKALSALALFASLKDDPRVRAIRPGSRKVAKHTSVDELQSVDEAAATSRAGRVSQAWSATAYEQSPSGEKLQQQLQDVREPATLSPPLFGWLGLLNSC